MSSIYERIDQLMQERPRPLSTSQVVYSIHDSMFTSILKLLSVNTPLLYTVCILTFILHYFTDTDMFISAFTYVFITSWSYFSHRWFHVHDDWKNLVLTQMASCGGPDSPHWSWFKSVAGFPSILHIWHHDPKNHGSTCMKWVETVLDFLVFGGFMWILGGRVLEHLIGIKFFNYYFILFWCTFYTSYHMFNYHYYHPDFHRKHHTTGGTHNFSPEWMDVYFYTKVDNTEFEILDTGIMNMVIIAVLLLLCQNHPWFSWLHGLSTSQTWTAQMGILFERLSGVYDILVGKHEQPEYYRNKPGPDLTQYFEHHAHVLDAPWYTQKDGMTSNAKLEKMLHVFPFKSYLKKYIDCIDRQRTTSSNAFQRLMRGTAFHVCVGSLVSSCAMDVVTYLWFPWNRR